MVAFATRVLAAVALTAALIVQPVTRPLGGAGATLVGPKANYLALGDSVTYGAQPNGDNSHGFADDLFQYLQARGTTTLVNMACRHETTTTFMKGGCPELSGVKYSYGSNGSQLAAALAFIRAHPGQVSPVTLEIGAADVDSDINPNTTPCTINEMKAVFDGGIAIANVGTILAQLKAALNGSGDLVLLDYFDPYQNQCPSLVQNVQTFNTNLMQQAQKAGVLFVDVYAAFGGGATPNSALCKYTWTYTCNNPPDIDANTQGYAVIASAVESVLNYPLPAATPTPRATATPAPQATAVPVTATPAPARPTASPWRRHSAPAATPTTPTRYFAVLPAAPAPRRRACRAHVPLKAGQYGRTIAGGQTLVVRLHTAARARVSLDLTVTTGGSTAATGGKAGKKAARTITLYRVRFHGTADASGRVTARLRIAYHPTRSHAARIKISASKGCAVAALVARLTIVPATSHP